MTGEIYMLQGNVPIKLNHNLKKNIAFRPFGISVLKDKLFVINEGLT